jgi:hypothetical protein
MAREIFNPNLALFVNVPEGGTTFQPNPNSVVQNDRGVNHLDFFKFVGRWGACWSLGRMLVTGGCKSLWGWPWGWLGSTVWAVGPCCVLLQPCGVLWGGRAV